MDLSQYSDTSYADKLLFWSLVRDNMRLRDRYTSWLWLVRKVRRRYGGVGAAPRFALDDVRYTFQTLCTLPDELVLDVLGYISPPTYLPSRTSIRKCPTSIYRLLHNGIIRPSRTQ